VAVQKIMKCESKGSYIDDGLPLQIPLSFSCRVVQSNK